MHSDVVSAPLINVRPPVDENENDVVDPTGSVPTSSISSTSESEEP